VDLQHQPTVTPEPGVADVCFVRAVAPLPPDLAWEVESLLLKIFEYGDYSLRSALAGEYSETLHCTFVLARRQGVLVGAAGGLHARANPTTALLGPVGVAREHRRNGIGAGLVSSIVDYLKAQGGRAVYLGVSKTNPAVHLYETAGFRPYQGIVMRLLLSPAGQLQDPHASVDANTVIRRVTWGDFPGVQALSVWPCIMHTFDLPRGIFSSRYCEPTRFLPIFPDMMRTFARAGGFANVLVAGERQNVVGIARIYRLPAQAQHHMAEFDFFVHDHFVAGATALAETTIRQSRALSIEKIHCRCLSCDDVKRQVLAQVGGHPIANLPGQVLLNGRYVDVLVYQIENTSPSKEDAATASLDPGAEGCQQANLAGGDTS
jgi:GNAT superfamily N-acetyltransferase